ncbi:MAG: hypothetical protein Q8P15_01720 [Nanoarchaeota archaeon]|nr:hypothetical protein [Nanoarchaeota archaeon]
MFNWFFGKKRVEEIKEETKKGFDSVKKDMISITTWIEHLDSEKKNHREEINEMKEILSTMKEDIEEMKNVVSQVSLVKTNRLFKTTKQKNDKQTGVYAVQTGVQTGVQTPNLEDFSITERAILWILLNTDMKLSYDDLAAILGKERSTIRGQINALKRKSESLIEEQIEKNGKKRVFIPENVKEKMLKKTKVRVRKKKN